jgi:hypothetical protein
LKRSACYLFHFEYLLASPQECIALVSDTFQCFVFLYSWMDLGLLITDIFNIEGLKLKVVLFFAVEFIMYWVLFARLQNRSPNDWDKNMLLYRASQTEFLI